MSLTQALMTSAAGLRTVQSGLALVSSNVANAETPGYVRKRLTQETVVGAGTGVSVRTAGINREIDQYVLRQLRTERSGGSYADMQARFYDRLQLLFGQPGATGTLEDSFNTMTTALQGLSASPDSLTARASVLNAGQVLARQLNTMSAGIQGLRAEAESGIADSVAQANEAMRQIASLNMRLGASAPNDASTAAMMDQRDAYIDQLSRLMDIRVVDTGNNQVTVFTNSGVQLVGTQASQLKFDARGMMTPDAAWSADPSQRSLGTISLISPNGDSVDLVANHSIRSGEIAAYLEMRDRTLPEAQAQLDAIAAAMASALSDQTTAGTAASAGAQNGFDIDLAGLQAGNSLRVTYTDVGSGERYTVTLMRVDDAGALPLGDDVTADPHDRVVGIDFSGGMASVAAQIGAVLGTDFTVSNPSGNTLRILDDGGVDVTMNGLTATKTITGLASGSAELPFFVDGSTPYTGAINANGNQFTGFASRIAVNASLLADPAKLVAYGPSTLAGDTTRPDFILQQLSQAQFTFSPTSGIGSAASPAQTTLKGFLQQVIGYQGAAAANASALAEGQSVVVSALEQRNAETSGVNIDEEMAHLLQLQAAYGANARVMSAVKEMLDLLSKI